MTVRADDKTKVYGSALPVLTASYLGLVNGDTSASLGVPTTLITTATESSGAGTYLIVVSGVFSLNYDIAFVNGILTVSRAPLTVTANNGSRAYGAPNPSFTASYSGFVNGDTPADLDAPAVFTTPATASSNAGTYPIIPAGASSADYSITFVNGVLTVNPVALIITADNKTKVYGQALPVFTASYAGFVNGDTAASLDAPVAFTTTATAASNVGTYSIVAGGAADVNYTISYVNGGLDVTRAPLTIAAQNKSKFYLASVPELTASYSGLVNGDSPASLDALPTLTTAATVTSPLGTYPIVITGGADANYNITLVNGTLTVMPIAPHLSIVGTGASAEVIIRITGQPGQTLELQESTDLKIWQNAATLSNPTGALDYVGPAGGAGSLKFYRVQVVQ